MKIVIVDDDNLVSLSLKTILEASGEVQVAEIGKNGAETILAEYPDARILFLTTFSDDEYIVRALRLGAKGYILKQDFESLLPVLTSVINGQSNKEIAERLYLSEGTVRNYLSSVLEKLELRDRTQLAVFYYKNLK